MKKATRIQKRIELLKLDFARLCGFSADVWICNKVESIKLKMQSRKSSSSHQSHQ